MSALHRHQLVWLKDSAWQRLREGDWDASARPCIEHWAVHRLPLVVTRQSCNATDDSICLGLSAPVRWSRQRLMLRISAQEISHTAEFPAAVNALSLLPEPVRAAWRKLCVQLAEFGIEARVYGSYGWQLLSGLEHIHERSDIDLWLAVSNTQQADSAVWCLRQFPAECVRVDGELLFADYTAVAWREWVQWRGGSVGSMLIKSLNASSMVTSLQMSSDVSLHMMQE